ncbi:MAG: OmpH family outer membrane protein [Desulfobacterales bacterium]
MKFKKSALIVMGCFFIFPVLHGYAADVAKIGVVDLQRVLMVSNPGKSAQADLKKQGGEIEEDFKAKEVEIRNLKDRLEREALVMSREMREEKEREYRIKIDDFKMLQKRRITELKELENHLVTKIRDDLMTIIEETGKKEGYLLIIDKAVAYYYPTAIDITDKIIQTYNNQKDSNKKSD